MKHHYISNITHNVVPDLIFDHNFLKLLTRVRNITKLTLKFTAVPYRTVLSKDRWKNKGEELRIKKIIRKIFVLCSKVQKVSINIDDTDLSFHGATVPFPFKCLLLAKYLKNFCCILKTSLFAHFRNLLKYCVIQNRRGLKPASFFHLRPEAQYLDFQRRDMGHFQSIIQEIGDLNKNAHLKFDFYFDDGEDEEEGNQERNQEEFQEILRFAQIFSKLQNVVELIIRPEQDGDHLLQFLKKSQVQHILLNLTWF